MIATVKPALLHRAAVSLSFAAGCAKSDPANEVAASPTEEVAPPLARVGKLAAANVRPHLSIWVTSQSVRVVRGVERSVHPDQMLVHADLDDVFMCGLVRAGGTDAPYSGHPFAAQR